MTRLLVLLNCTVLLALLTTTSALADATVRRESLSFPISLGVCPDTSVPHTLFLSVDLLAVDRLDPLGNGTFRFATTSNFHGSAFDPLTGITYRFKDVLNVTQILFSLPSIVTATETIQLIDPGGGQNLLAQATVHMTVNANGVLTADQDRFLSGGRCVG